MFSLRNSLNAQQVIDKIPRKKLMQELYTAQVEKKTNIT